MGKAVSDWKTLPKDTLTTGVQEAVKTNLEKGFSFLFQRCGYIFGSIFQTLTFPPILKKVGKGQRRRGIDINVVMLDSISRPHFYRIMPRAVEALRKIVQDPNIKATALDFELVQSIGQQTFENLRPFFSGVLKGKRIVTFGAVVWITLTSCVRLDIFCTVELPKQRQVKVDWYELLWCGSPTVQLAFQHV